MFWVDHALEYIAATAEFQKTPVTTHVDTVMGGVDLEIFDIYFHIQISENYQFQDFGEI